MGEELNALTNGRLYISSGDGKYVSFAGITEAEIVDDSAYKKNSVFASLPSEMHFSGVIEIKSMREDRRMWKFLRKEANKARRRIRYSKRMKEYARRRKLKGARYL